MGFFDCDALMRNITLLLLFLCLSVGAATLNVPGSYATIQAAANVAAPGDTVIVAAGFYPERVTNTTSGTVGNPITFTGPYAAHGTMRTATNYGFHIPANYVNVQFFCCSNNGVATGATKYDEKAFAGISVYGGNNLILSNDCYWGASFGIYCDTTCSNYQVIGNRCWSNGSAGMQLYLGKNNPSSTVVQYNEIWGIQQEGPQQPKGVDAYGDCDGMQLFGYWADIGSNYIHGLNWTNSNNPSTHGPHVDGFQTWSNSAHGFGGISGCAFHDNVIYCTNINGAAFYAEYCESNAVYNNIFVAKTVCSGYGRNRYYNNLFVSLSNPNIDAIYPGSECGFFYNGSSFEYGGISFYPDYGWATNNIIIGDLASVYDIFGAANVTNGTGYPCGQNLVFTQAGTVHTNGMGKVPYGTVWFLNKDPGLVDAYTSSEFSMERFKCVNRSSLPVDNGVVVPLGSDLLGVVRPQGAAIDLGPFEYVPVGNVGPTNVVIQGNSIFSGNVILN